MFAIKQLILYAMSSAQNHSTTMQENNSKSQIWCRKKGGERKDFSNFEKKYGTAKLQKT
jgi:hypothetical protein